MFRQPAQRRSATSVITPVDVPGVAGSCLILQLTFFLVTLIAVEGIDGPEVVEEAIE